ncbi:MAG TPA: acetolactate synthase large subunit [Thermoanaerobaculia bacterium]|nr:acetolactate synthase large subunit [Thermoanaerobaculia bacterium]
MNGAEILVRTAAAHGIEVCFTNPGTTEMHLVAALDSQPGLRAVLGLFEGVVTGAADGYGRMAAKPAMTLLHLGPGFANGIANLHNARRAATPIVNLIGHHATWHRNFDPPLESQVELLAAAVSVWQRTCAHAGQLSRDLADAIAASLRLPGGSATLVVPADCQWDEAGERIAALPPVPIAVVDGDRIDLARKQLSAHAGQQTVLLLGGRALTERGLLAAARIATASGCRLACESFPPRLERGPHLPALPRVPYFPEQALAFFMGARQVVLAGAREPVAFFGYRDGPSLLIPEGVAVEVLAGRDEDVPKALEDLAEALGAPAQFQHLPAATAAAPRGALDAANIAAAVVAAQPEGAIIVDEGITGIGPYYELAGQAPAHTYLALPGGAIGFGLPCSVGAAIACPRRKVIVLEGDGSGLYTAQALWSQAREGLDIVNVVLRNDVYRILQIELHRAGVQQPGPQSLAMTELSNPSVDWVGLAQSFGVPACSVTTAEALYAELARAVAEPGPALIEVRVG